MRTGRFPYQSLLLRWLAEQAPAGRMVPININGYSLSGQSEYSPIGRHSSRKRTSKSQSVRPHSSLGKVFVGRVIVSALMGTQFHAGELAAQARAGMAPRAAAIRDWMLDQQRQFFTALPFIVAATIDEDGWPVATILAGPPGSLRARMRRPSASPPCQTAMIQQPLG
jgi:hypothetical protein